MVYLTIDILNQWIEDIIERIHQELPMDEIDSIPVVNLNDKVSFLRRKICFIGKLNDGKKQAMHNLYQSLKREGRGVLLQTTETIKITGQNSLTSVIYQRTKN